MIGVLVFASVASAEHTAAHVRAGSNGGPCSGDKPFEATLAGDPGEGSLQCFATQAEANAYSNSGPDASPTASPIASPTASPTASPSATATASAAGAAQYQYNSALPDTGGVSPATLLAIVPAILLVGGGLLSAGLLRRR
jgi:hypothetical protein